MTARDRPDYLPTLDGWRALAVSGVILLHASWSFAHSSAFWEFWNRYGPLGVDVFFGISGILITTRLLETLRENGRMDLKGFYIRRALRILPPAWLFLAVIGILGAAGPLSVRRWDLLSALLLFRNYWRPDWYTWHFWSLAVEEHFYLIWPGILAFCGRRRALGASAFLALGVAAWRFLESHHLWLGRWLPRPDLYSLRTDIRLDGLFWGCWMALLLDIPLWRRRLTRWLSLPAWLGLVAIFIAYSCTKARPYMLCQAFLIPLILAGTVLRPQGIPGRILELAPLRWIGRISYSLYLWQQLFTDPKSGLGRLAGFPLNILLILLTASLSHYLLERPLIRLGRRLANKYSPRYTTAGDEPAHSAGAYPGLPSASGGRTA